SRVERILESIARRIPRIKAEVLVRSFHDLMGGFQIMRSPLKLVISLVLTAGVWVLTLFVAYFTMMAFLPARFDEVGLVVVLSNLGGALPSAPGGLGVVQFFATQSLVIPFNVAEPAAVAFAFVWSLFQQFALILLGFFGLVRMGLSFNTVTTKAQGQETIQPEGQQASIGK
ncbi:MAG TPA: lysylphosphatidylglycerol synthase transmembrane domain-containing protein, partial [Anaerolineae bacterium]